MDRNPLSRFARPSPPPAGHAALPPALERCCQPRGTASHLLGEMQRHLVSSQTLQRTLLHEQSLCREPPSPERDLPLHPAPEVSLAQGCPAAGGGRRPNLGTQARWAKSPWGAKQPWRRREIPPPPAVGAVVLDGVDGCCRFAPPPPAAGAELPRASQRASRGEGRQAALLRSLRQIISYLQTLPPRQSPLTSFTQPR